MITCKFRLAFPDENHLPPIHGCSGSGGSQATTSGALLRQGRFQGKPFWFKVSISCRLMEGGVFLYEKTCRRPWEADDTERLVSVTMSLRMLCSVCRSKCEDPAVSGMGRGLCFYGVSKYTVPWESRPPSPLNFALTV